ncbi:hypothetical protein GCM10009696_36030 [Kocuria himachalensis]
MADRDLHTNLFRLRGSTSEQIEPHILRNFRKYAARDTSPGDSDWNWLSVAQHHGRVRCGGALRVVGAGGHRVVGLGRDRVVGS